MKLLLRPQEGYEVCYERVCLSAHMSQKPYAQTFLYMLPVDLARFFSSNDAVMSYTSGFVDDVTFTHIGAYRDSTFMS